MAVSLFSSLLYAELYSDSDLAACLDDAADVAAMIRFEAALAKVQGELGIIPAEAAETIAAALSDVAIDPSALAGGTRSAGVPVPALVNLLHDHCGPDAGNWLHWGATSQDVMDIGVVLQIKTCLDILAPRLTRVIDLLEDQSRKHADQLLAGRTRSQVSTPITLGYRIAQWAHPLIKVEADLNRVRTEVLRIQFGGASGVNTAIAPDGHRVSKVLAEELDLANGPSWHTERSGILALSVWLQQVGAGLAKMAGDLILLGRSDIGEVHAGTGGGSSTMPQKANPVQAEAIVTLNQITLAAAGGLGQAASPLEERDGTKWPLEWAFLPQMIIAVGTALRHAEALAETLRPDSDRIAMTLEAHPEIMAETASFILAQKGMSRADAKDLITGALADKSPFAVALKRLSAFDIDWTNALRPETAIAPSQAMAEQIFATRNRPSGNLT